MGKQYYDRKVRSLIGYMILGLVLVAFPAAEPVFGDTQEQIQTTTVSAPRIEIKTLTIESNHTRLIKLPAPAKRVSVGSAEVADVIMITPDQLYINALKVGSTNISLWDQQNRLMGVFEVRVARDLARLKERLHQVLPGEPIEVRELEGGVILSGRVSSLESKRKAEAVGKAFAPKMFTSLVEVGGIQQVMLEVKLAEVFRREIKKLKVNLGFFDSAGGFIFSFLNQLTKPLETSIGLDSFSTELDFSKDLNGFWGFPAGNTKVLGFLDALKENGLATILAEPNLIATSGQVASFLAGGEFPIPVPQKDAITIVFKEYGVRLKFKPEVMSSGRIKLQVEPEVSEIDFSTALVIEGFTVPGLTTRNAKTELELDDGQSFAIAGLLRDDLTQVVSKFPVLGDIPILGALFRSTDYQAKKTDLLIVVTPRIVKNKQMYAGSRLPTDGLSVPTDWKLYMEGAMVQVPEYKKASTQVKQPMLPQSLKEMEGKFGHEWID